MPSSPQRNRNENAQRNAHTKNLGATVCWLLHERLSDGLVSARLPSHHGGQHRSVASGLERKMVSFAVAGGSKKGSRQRQRRAAGFSW